MAKIAIDVALIPAEKMMDLALSINKKILKENNSELVLNKNCLPHISLMMGVIEEKDLSEIKAILSNTLKQTSLGTFNATSLNIGALTTGEKVASFGIKNTKELQKLHDILAEKLAPFMSYDATSEMLYGTVANETTLAWIKMFPKKGIMNFNPHITLGFGEVDNIDLPIEFSIAKLGLYHLGNNCTCREALFEFKI